MARTIVSIDIGTTKICVMIAQHLDGDKVEILGMGKAPSYGLKKGVVVDIAKTIHSIKQAVQEAQLMAGIEIDAAYVGISGSHIQSCNSRGMTTLKHGEIREDDIANVIASAKAVPIPEGQQILHVLPQFYIIDGHERVQDPLGMHGVRLEVQAHIIMGGIASVQNLVKCCEKAGVKVQDIVLEQLASADAVLSEDERELGVAIIDIGGGTSDVALYQQGNIRHTMVLPVAGNHFTNDIAIGLRTTIDEAERVKIYNGTVSPDAKKENSIEIQQVHGQDTRMASAHEIASIVRPRARELLAIINDEVKKYSLQQFMASGIVLTGGGSLLDGMPELAHKLFKVPARIGIPHVAYDLPESIAHPMYATGYGLLRYAIKKQRRGTINGQGGSTFQQILMRMRSWVTDFF